MGRNRDKERQILSKSLFMPVVPTIINLTDWVIVSKKGLSESS
jgi:hypothetical protein